MAELKKVRLDQIDPNPFRDGSGGTATWETVEDNYPVSRRRLETLKNSIQSIEFWEGVIVRPMPHKDKLRRQRFQLAFGHHRYMAAKELGIESIPVISKPLNDDKMLAYMANENSEDFNASFGHTMAVVEATVKGYAEGRIQLPLPKLGHRSRTDQLRCAPYFAKGSGMPTPTTTDSVKMYTAQTIAFKLNWTVGISENNEKKAAERLAVALSVLADDEAGYLQKSDFVGLSNEDAKVALERGRVARKLAQKELDAKVAVLEAAKELAEKQGEAHKVERLETQITNTENRQEKAVNLKGASAAADVAKELAAGTVAQADVIEKNAEMRASHKYDSSDAKGERTLLGEIEKAIKALNNVGAYKGWAKAFDEIRKDRKLSAAEKKAAKELLDNIGAAVARLGTRAEQIEEGVK